jgi:hypothetical protein
MGPVINQASEDKVLSYIALGKNEGELVAGGKKAAGDGYFIEPTIFADIKPGSRLDQEEIFGPVLGMMHVDSVEEAIALVNIGARYSSINILKGGRSTFTGDVPVGGRDITEALVRDLNLSVEHAEAVKTALDEFRKAYSLAKSTAEKALAIKNLGESESDQKIMEEVDRIRSSGEGSFRDPGDDPGRQTPPVSSASSGPPEEPPSVRVQPFFSEIDPPASSKFLSPSSLDLDEEDLEKIYESVHDLKSVNKHNTPAEMQRMLDETFLWSNNWFSS